MKKFALKALLLSAFTLTATAHLFAEMEPLHHNPWELIIYRPENTGTMNDIRCFLEILDEEGNDVTYTAVKATYEWVSIPDKVNFYRKKYYLSGGMAMHLTIRRGRYKFTFYTPETEQQGFAGKKHGTWTSNSFLYDTQNPAKVIFVAPTANENGFYDGGWHISGTAPAWFKFTKPYIKNTEQKMD